MLLKMLRGILGAMSGQDYIQAINTEIDKLCSELNRYAGNRLSDERLAGFMAEHWHAGTFNINAVIEGSSIEGKSRRVEYFGVVDMQLILIRCMALSILRHHWEQQKLRV